MSEQSVTRCQSGTAEDFAILREVETEWLANELSRAIRNLPCSVGMGIEPPRRYVENAATILFERYARMIKVASESRTSRDDAVMDALEADLVQRCGELIEWSRTGLLAGGSGGAVRALADNLRKTVGDTYALNVAESQTRDDAMRALVAIAALQGAKP